MNVSVNVFEFDFDYFVKPTVTVEQLYDAVAERISLKNRSLFGLQAFHAAKQCMIWLRTNGSGGRSRRLIDTIRRDGIAFRPIVQFYLRAKQFPANFDTVAGEDPAAMRLYYREIVNRRWSQGYRADRPLEMCLLSLVMLAEIGPLKSALASRGGDRYLCNVIKRYLIFYHNVEEDTEKQSKIAEESVLRLWNVFADMTRDEAIYNYVSIASSIAGFSVQTAHFEAKKEKFETEEKVRISIGFEGIEIWNQNKNFANKTAQKLDWFMIQKVTNCGASIIIQLNENKNAKKDDADNRSQTITETDTQTETEYSRKMMKNQEDDNVDQNDDKNEQIFRFRCETSYTARRFFKLLIAYHRMHLRNRIAKATATAANRTQPYTRLAFANAEQFLRQLVNDRSRRREESHSIDSNSTSDDSSESTFNSKTTEQQKHETKIEEAQNSKGKKKEKMEKQISNNQIILPSLMLSTLSESITDKLVDKLEPKNDAFQANVQAIIENAIGQILHISEQINIKMVTISDLINANATAFEKKKYNTSKSDLSPRSPSPKKQNKFFNQSIEKHCIEINESNKEQHYNGEQQKTEVKEEEEQQKQDQEKVENDEETKFESLQNDGGNYDLMETPKEILIEESVFEITEKSKSPQQEHLETAIEIEKPKNAIEMMNDEIQEIKKSSRKLTPMMMMSQAENNYETTSGSENQNVMSKKNVIKEKAKNKRDENMKDETMDCTEIVESARRKRFAKLRLALFEHVRFG